MWQESILAIIALLALAGRSCRAASDLGVVLEVTSDTITIGGNSGKATYKVCPELLTNVPQRGNRFWRPAKFTEVRKGYRIGVEYYDLRGDRICTEIEIIPTEVENENARKKADEENENARKKRQEGRDQKLDHEKGDFNFVETGTGKG